MTRHSRICFGTFAESAHFTVPTDMYTVQAETLLRGLLVYHSARTFWDLNASKPGGMLKGWKVMLKPWNGKMWQEIHSIKPAAVGKQRLEIMKVPIHGQKNFRESYDWSAVRVSNVVRAADGELQLCFNYPLYFSPVSKIFLNTVNSDDRHYADKAKTSGTLMQKLKERLAFDLWYTGYTMLEEDFKTDEMTMGVWWHNQWPEDEAPHHYVSFDRKRLDEMRNLLQGSSSDNAYAVKLKGMPLDAFTASAIEVIDRKLDDMTGSSDENHIAKSDEILDILKKRFNMMQAAVTARHMQ